MILGGGRATKEDVIDLSVGVVLSKKKGDMVEKGETIATIYSNNADKAKEAEYTVLDAYTIVPEYIEKDKLIKLIIE